MKKHTLYISILLVCLLLVESASPVFAAQSNAKKTVTVRGGDAVVTSWISQSDPKENVSSLIDFTYITVGKSKKGRYATGLVRFDLPAGITPDEVISAKLLFKKKSGSKPSVKVGIATTPWSPAEVSWNEMKGKTKYAASAPRLKKDRGGWYSANVKSIVKRWLSGKADNYGFMLRGTKKGSTTNFFSTYANSAKDRPRLKFVYKDKKSKKQYGRFGYTKQSSANGNCMAYAMRDKDAIFFDDLLTAAEQKTLQDISNNNGEAAALSYFKGKVFDYMNAHQKDLGIQSWRELTGFSDKINPKQEYMTVLKIGFVSKGYGSGPNGAYDIVEDFDYHWRVRLKDGRWAEKVTNTATRIIPGSNPVFNAAKYPWDSNYSWGYSKWNDFYNSKPVYLAITKSTDTFTAHKH